jgi:hypothetical protein
MKRLGHFLTLVAVAALGSMMIAPTSWSQPYSSTRGRVDRVKYYTQKYQQECRPQLLCTAECRDLYDFLHREGIDLGGPCGPR